MSTLSCTHKSCFFALLLASLLAGTVDASAGQYGWTTFSRPGIACRSQPDPNEGANWTNLGNWTYGTQTFWCPLQGTDAALMSNLSVNLTSGWATTTSCTLAFIFPNSGYWYNANSIAKNSGFDTLQWSNPQSPSSIREVECSVPSGQMLMDYNERMFVYFDWTSW